MRAGHLIMSCPNIFLNRSIFINIPTKKTKSCMRCCPKKWVIMSVYLISSATFQSNNLRNSMGGLQSLTVLMWIDTLRILRPVEAFFGVIPLAPHKLWDVRVWANPYIICKHLKHNMFFCTHIFRHLFFLSNKNCMQQHGQWHLKKKQHTDLRSSNFSLASGMVCSFSGHFLPRSPKVSPDL